MKSVLSILLIISMLLSFVACSGEYKPAKDTSPVTTASADTTASSIIYEEDDLPDNLNFGGKPVTILSPDHANHSEEISVEDLNSDVVNDSIYNREKFVEDRLGVEIENIQVLPENYETTIDKQIASDEDNYQILAYSVAAFPDTHLRKTRL